jgi:hypothetical protein
MVEINLENNIYLKQVTPNNWRIAEKRIYTYIDKDGKEITRVTNHNPKNFPSPDKALEYYFLGSRLDNYNITTLDKLIEILDEGRKILKEKLGVVNE